jgi:hypothetical protein
MMKRKCVARSVVDRLREVPGNKLGNDNGCGIGRCKSRKVQRLANVACCVSAAILMFVDECAASCEKEESATCQERHRSLGSDPAENVLRETHSGFRLHSTVAL